MSEVFFEKIVNYGVLGAVCVWFMFRVETVINANTKAVTDMGLMIQKLCEAKEK